MISSPKTLKKLVRIEATYRERIFFPIKELLVDVVEVTEHFRSVPGNEYPWRLIRQKEEWGGAGKSAWFRCEWIAEQDCNEPVFIMADTGGCEALLFINGKPSGIYNHADYKWQRGDHRALLLAERVKKGDHFSIAVEAYAGHEIIGVHPGDTAASQDAYRPPFKRVFGGFSLALQDELVKDFVVDLHVARTLCEALGDRSFRKGELLSVLNDVFAVLWEEPERVENSVWRSGLVKARELLGSSLARRNGDSAPFAGLIGHSHLDTAWLWTVDETIRKCARTYSNVLSLMEQYPEYCFIQSSALHADFMREHYPHVFEGIKQRVSEGRWEPNGGVWVEPDVNLAGGEAIIRQFLLGQRFTREHFGYTSDTFWLPDTFGYSAALPQIMLGCGIRYFLTTKLSWNDTNSFPYDTFRWQGIDGSTVFTHFNDIHCAPDPGTLINKLEGSGPKDFRLTENCVRHPDVNQARLISFGRGDGGGGPDFEMLEVARRVKNLDGCPRGEYTTVSRFMKKLEATSVRAPLYSGELYFEGHRGVFTQQAMIKQLNRACETALRNLDYCAARLLLIHSGDVSSRKIESLWKILLLNQFHDILPGTSIPEVHDRAIRELEGLLRDAKSLTEEYLEKMVSTSCEGRVSIHNTLGWVRNSGWIRAEKPVPAGVLVQQIETPWGERRKVCHGLNLPPLGARAFEIAENNLDSSEVPFRWEDNVLISPHSRIEFDDAGAISSWVDTETGRELRDMQGPPLNRFVFGEDIPAEWDNWDIDADLESKLSPLDKAVERMTVTAGSLQIRVRHHIPLTQKSWIVQDTVIHAHTKQVDFETLVHWEEPHRYLGTEFALSVRAPYARHEIQFGHIQRGTHRNFAEDRARFEVSQHKWSDFSEANFGVALLNDGKYGLSVRENRVRLSLMKGGGHPDPRGNPGDHSFTYSMLPHRGGFSVPGVVHAAYELNVPLLVHSGGTAAAESICTVEEESVVVETIKPAEDGNGVIVRAYDAAGGASKMGILTDKGIGVMGDYDLLEGATQTKEWYPPFAIRTIKIN